MLAAVLFDLDGTLADTLAMSCLAFRRAVERADGRSLSDAEIKAHFGPSEDGMLQRVLPDGWQRAYDLYLDEFVRVLPTCRVDDAMAAALRLLRQRRVRTAVVTGKSRPTALLSLKHFGIADAFDAIETGSPAGIVKAEAIQRLLAGWRLAPAQAVYVGDAAADMRAAREAGVTAAGAAWGYGGDEMDLQAAGADVVFTNAGQCLAWLDARTRGGT